MRGLFRTIAALLAVLLLLTAAALGMVALFTDGGFLRLTGTQALRAQQQERIDQAARELTLRWGLATDVLMSCTANAAQKHSDTLAEWWHALWNEPHADTAIPPFFDAVQERTLVQTIMEDPGYQAVTDPGQYRAIARDEIVYALDEAVCDAVLPVRRSIVGLAVSTMADVLDLSLLRQAVLVGAAVLAAAALVLLIMAQRAAGCTLFTAGLTMALITLPVWALDLCGMLKQLNPLAAQQGWNLLTCAGVVWYGVALALMVLGLLLLMAKRAVGRKVR